MAASLPLLTLDRGNSTLDCMLHGAGEPAPRRRLAPDDLAGLRQFLAVRPTAAVGVTVVTDGLAAATTMLQAQGIPLQLAGTHLPCPLPLDYATPQTLGADRWLAALAAFSAHGRAITIDCGSATTINLVEADGTFRGGAIAPGLRALQAGLAAAAPALPAADFEQLAWPPRSSIAAVSAGIAAAFCGTIERAVADLLRVARGPCTLVLTGGNAPFYLAHGRLQPRHVPDLIHQALRLLAERACGS